MHPRISKKIFIYLFIFIILVTITNRKLTFDFYKIKEFDIISSHDLDIKRINKDLRNLINKSIFLFDEKDISKIIYSNRAIEEFEVLKVYPSKLIIKIKKTEFLAITKQKGLDYLVGANGNLIENEDFNHDLPYIFGNIDTKNFLTFKKIIDNSNFDYSEIESIFYFNSNRWDIINKKGLVLKLPHKLTAKKLNLIHEIIRKDNFIDVKIFDFRQNDLMITNE